MDIVFTTSSLSPPHFCSKGNLVTTTAVRTPAQRIHFVARLLEKCSFEVLSISGLQKCWELGIAENKVQSYVQTF